MFIPISNVFPKFPGQPFSYTNLLCLKERLQSNFYGSINIIVSNMVSQISVQRDERQLTWGGRAQLRELSALKLDNCSFTRCDQLHWHHA